MTHHMYCSIKISIIIVILLQSLLINAQWRDLWRDDFNGAYGSQPSRSIWMFRKGNSPVHGTPDHWGTGEVQSYTDKVENLKLDGQGHLLIIPLRDGSRKWTSARIETQRSDFKPPTPGGKLAIEARIQMPNVKGIKAVGYWPAFWAMGAPYRGNYKNWPSIGEFDIMENVNGLNFNKGVLHCGVAEGGPCNEPEGLGQEVVCPGTSCQSFHTYRFEWDNGTKEFRWYVDGNLYFRLNRNAVGTDVWNQITNHGYYILLNVAIGGGYPDYMYNGQQGSTPLLETEPGHPMVVDYVKVQTYS